MGSNSRLNNAHICFINQLVGCLNILKLVLEIIISCFSTQILISRSEFNKPQILCLIAECNKMLKFKNAMQKDSKMQPILDQCVNLKYISDF